MRIDPCLESAKNGKASAELLLRGGRLTSLEHEFFTRGGSVFLFLFGRFFLRWHVSSVNDFPLQGALDPYYAQLLEWAVYLAQDIAVYYSSCQ